ncbi:MAG: DMT family transporter [Alphaproteobacteria bacterium]
MTDAALATQRAVRVALLLLVLSTLSVGISGTFVRLSETGPTATAFWRMALAIPAMGVLMALEGRRTGTAPVRPSAGWDYFLLAAAGVVFGYEMGVWHIGLMMTSVANATLLSNCSPILVALGTWLVLRQPLSRTFLLGMTIALSGAGILMGEDFSLSLNQVYGDALAVVAAMLWGLYILIVARLRVRFGAPVIMLWTCVFASLALLPFPFILDETFLPSSLAGWAIVLSLALVCQAAGQTLLTAALAHLPATFSSVAFLMVPFNAALIAWLVLGEPVRPLQALGAVVVLAGVVLARRGTR